MILLDLNQVIIASLMVSAPGNDLDENMMRHITLNTIRAYRNQFKEEYGELVICCDNKQVWRKTYFPFYKAHRKKARKESPYDWHVIFDSLDKIRNELKEYFPYKVIDVECAEADDIIGVLARDTSSGKKTLILSSDKDFLQLQKYDHISQYSPILKKFIKTDDPLRYVKEHILRGDRGDGIPNFLSADNTFVTGGRQKVLSTKKLTEYMEQSPEKFCSTDTLLRGYKRNQTLIDLDYIPGEVKEKILESFKVPANKVPSDKMIQYFMAFKLKNLMDSIRDFR